MSFIYIPFIPLYRVILVVHSEVTIQEEWGDESRPRHWLTPLPLLMQPQYVQLIQQLKIYCSVIRVWTFHLSYGLTSGIPCRISGNVKICYGIFLDKEDRWSFWFCVCPLNTWLLFTCIHMLLYKFHSVLVFIHTYVTFAWFRYKY